MSRQELLHFEKHIDLMKGVSGGSMWIASILASHIADIEAWLRISSLLVGIAVGLVTIRSITRKNNSLILTPPTSCHETHFLPSSPYLSQHEQLH